MFACGFTVASCVWMLVIIALFWREKKQDVTQHQRYVREWQRAEYGWRHPRMMRHKRKLPKLPAPLPMDWGL